MYRIFAMCLEAGIAAVVLIPAFWLLNRYYFHNSRRALGCLVLSVYLAAVDAVVAGDSYFSAALLGSMTRSMTRHMGDAEDEDALSEREVEILMEVCRGLSNQEIADKLFISKRTVDKHRANILEKTGCKNTANLVVYAIKNRLAEV